MGDLDLFLLGFLLRLLLLFNLSQCLRRLGVWILEIVVLWEKRTVLIVCLFVEEHILIFVLCETRTILIVCLHTIAIFPKILPLQQSPSLTGSCRMSS